MDSKEAVDFELYGFTTEVQLFSLHYRLGTDPRLEIIMNYPVGTNKNKKHNYQEVYLIAKTQHR